MNGDQFSNSKAPIVNVHALTKHAVEISNCFFANNIGTAIRLEYMSSKTINNSSVLISGNIFTGNQGGSVISFSGKGSNVSIIHKNLLSKNNAGVDDLVHLEASQTTLMLQNYIFNNTGGTIIYSSKNNNLHLINNHIVNNFATNRFRKATIYLKNVNYLIHGNTLYNSLNQHEISRRKKDQINTNRLELSKFGSNQIYNLIDNKDRIKGFPIGYPKSSKMSANCPIEWNEKNGECIVHIGVPLTYQDAYELCSQTLNGQIINTQDIIEEKVWSRALTFQNCSYIFNNTIHLSSCFQRHSFMCQIVNSKPRLARYIAITFAIGLAFIISIFFIFVCWFKKHKNESSMCPQKSSISSVQGSKNFIKPGTVLSRPLSSFNVFDYSRPSSIVVSPTTLDYKNRVQCSVPLKTFYRFSEEVILKTGHENKDVKCIGAKFQFRMNDSGSAYLTEDELPNAGIQVTDPLLDKRETESSNYFRSFDGFHVSSHVLGGCLESASLQKNKKINFANLEQIPQQANSSSGYCITETTNQSVFSEEVFV